MKTGFEGLIHSNRRKHPPGELFLKGPIPWPWLGKAMQLPGKALAVALHVWWRSGIERSSCIMINLSRLSVDRSAASRGLAALEAAGLVTVIRAPGRRPRVTIVR